jgi:hypothetical protein
VLAASGSDSPPLGEGDLAVSNRTRPNTFDKWMSRAWASSGNSPTSILSGDMEYPPGSYSHQRRYRGSSPRWERVRECPLGGR